jgi:hypothetical protein
VAYIPAIEFDGPLPPMRPFFKLGDEFWKLPGNWKEIRDEVRWAAKDAVPVQVSGPQFLVINLVVQPEKRRMLLHLINYNARSVDSTGPIEVSCRLPSQTTAREARVYSPDEEPAVSIAVSNGPSGATFTLPTVRTYSIAAVSW